jgi:16S rRNA (guanine527-N7)-methyltransferase
MTSGEFRSRLAERAQGADVALSPRVVEELDEYFRLLVRWNETINLTALPLRDPSDETIDRLLIEPLAAARHVADAAFGWFDLGSGGGSPAIPLKIVRPKARLRMIESKARKAAFLREAVRVIGLSDTDVLNCRFEAVADEIGSSERAQLVTVRAVRSDRELFANVHRLLEPGGRLLLFRSQASTEPDPRAFKLIQDTPLPCQRTNLAIYEATCEETSHP